MFNWRSEILNHLNTERWIPLWFFALSFSGADLEDLERLKNEISLLKKEGRISLQQSTPEEILDEIKNYYNKRGESVDEENMWVKWEKEKAEDLKNFFTNSARLIKK